MIFTTIKGATGTSNVKRDNSRVRRRDRQKEKLLSATSFIHYFPAVKIGIRVGIDAKVAGFLLSELYKDELVTREERCFITDSGRSYKWCYKRPREY